MLPTFSSIQSNNKVSFKTFTSLSHAKIELFSSSKLPPDNVFMKCIKQKYYYEAEAEACNFTKKDFLKSIL